jgi:hypothetical protein
MNLQLIESIPQVSAIALNYQEIEAAVAVIYES